MTAARPRILAINGGSSSIRFALYEVGSALERRLHGKVERIGLPGTTLTLIRAGRDAPPSRSDIASDRAGAVQALIDRLEAESGLITSLAAVGHRIVHGMEHTEPERIGARLLAELRRLVPYDPDHLPLEIALIEAFRQRHRPLPQVACFDTAFHRTLPRVARLLAIPRRYEAQGVRRYGFHGLSYAYVMRGAATPRRSGGNERPRHPRPSRQRRQPGGSARRPQRRHQHGLHAGLRRADEHAGRRPGSRAARPFLAQRADDGGSLRSHGQSRIRAARDFGDQLRRARPARREVATDVRAAEAVALFCYQVRKCIGAFAAALGGVDTLVFSGGIGENAALIREQICDGLGFLGIELDRVRNAADAALISAEAGRVGVRVIRTDEELMIAGSVARALSLGTMEDSRP